MDVRVVNLGTECSLHGWASPEPHVWVGPGPIYIQRFRNIPSTEPQFPGPHTYTIQLKLQQVSIFVLCPLHSLCCVIFRGLYLHMLMLLISGLHYNHHLDFEEGYEDIPVVWLESFMEKRRFCVF